MGERVRGEAGRASDQLRLLLPPSPVAFLGLPSLAVLQPPSALQSSALQPPSTPRSSTHPARGGWGGGREGGRGMGGTGERGGKKGF